VTSLLALVAIGAVAVVLRRQLHLERQNRELLALDQASSDVHSELALEKLLSKVTDQARALIGARYGALSVLDGGDGIVQFVTSGISAQDRERIGPPPQGHGVLGEVLREKKNLRLDDISRHHRSVGFPEHHPPMRTLLAVPLPSRSAFRGNLYLTEKKGRSFSTSDEETLTRFAAKAAQAIDNAYLHQQLQALAVAEERVRLSREMHDGTAQVLAYVNTKAQVAQEHLKRGRPELASTHLDQLAAASRGVYADVREGIAALRTEVGLRRPLTEGLEEYLSSWQDRNEVATKLRIEGQLHLSLSLETQLLRIVQEALANVRKHAAARQVEVLLRREAQTLLLRVTDDGCGFDLADLETQDAGHFGLAIMEERSQAIGGILKVISAPGEGTTIELQLNMEP